MNPKTLWVGGLSLLVVGFLLGFLPQYLKVRTLQQQLEEARSDIAKRSEDVQRQELGLLIGHVYLETNRKNYGLASQYSTRFFDRARAMAGQTSNQKLESLMQSLLARRDAITGGLAKAESGSAEAIQDLFQQVLDAVQAEKN